MNTEMSEQDPNEKRTVLELTDQEVRMVKEAKEVYGETGMYPWEVKQQSSERLDALDKLTRSCFHVSGLCRPVKADWERARKLTTK